MEGLGGARLGVFEALSLSGPDGSNGLDVDGGDGGQRAAPLPRVGLRCLVRKRLFLRHCIVKLIIFTKTGSGQTQQEQLREESRFLTVGNAASRSTAPIARSAVRKTHVFAIPFYAKNDRFTKTRSGQT